MARLSRLEIAKSDIFKLFDEIGNVVYNKEQIGVILSNEREFWRVAKRTTTAAFIEFLINKGKLQEHYLSSDSYGRSHTRYSWGTGSPYQLGLSMKLNSYLCHGTAVFLHGLNDQIPKVVYVNEEQSKKPRGSNELQQSSLKMAFSRKQRISKMTISSNQDDKFVVVNGKRTDGLGVEDVVGFDGEALRATNVERTLIDIAVRPAYAGGISHVLDAYIGARDVVSVNRLNALLTKLDYIYPYHQSIGFLMEKAEYKESQLKMMRKKGLNYDFYLSHGMKETEFNKDWRLHIPRGF